MHLIRSTSDVASEWADREVRYALVCLSMILGRVLYAVVCLSMLLELYPSVCHQCSKKWIFEGRLLRHGFQKCASRCSEEHIFAHGRKKCIMIKLWRQLSDKSVQMSRSQMRTRRRRRMVIAKMWWWWYDDDMENDDEDKEDDDNDDDDVFMEPQR